MSKFTMVFGTHGSGKTTLVKNFLMSDYESSDGDFLFDCFDFYEKKSEYGKYTISKGEKFVAVGSYQNKCGGADGIKDNESYFGIIRLLVDNFKDKDIFVEGVMQHRSEDLLELFNYIEGKGFEINLVFLTIDLNVAVARIVSRSGKEPKIKNVKGKMSGVVNQYNFFNSLNRFSNCILIDTTDLDSDTVFDTVRNIMYGGV